MRNLGSVFRYERERNKDLIRVFNQELKKLDYTSINEVWKRVANSSTKRFWVSEQRALIVIARIMRGDDLKSCNPQRREMFFEIYRRFMETKRLYPHCSSPQVMHMVVSSEAPKFYLTPSTVRVIIYKIQRGWYDNKNR